MAHRTNSLPLLQPRRILLRQDLSIALLLLKYTRLNLVLGYQELLTRSAPQIISLRRFPERDRGHFVGAEDDHIGEVAGVFQEGLGCGRGVFTVDAAGGEDGFYGADYETGGGKEEITGVILIVGLGSSDEGEK